MSTNEFYIPMEHVFRHKEEEIKALEDYHAVYASSRVHRIAQGSVPKSIIFYLRTANNEAMGTSESEVKFRMKGIVTKNETGSPTVVERELIYEDDGKFKLELQDGDTDEANFFLAEIELEDDTNGKLISPKKLRIEIVSAGGV